jgi:cyclic pyranopterin phosphate synthase
MNLKQIDTLVQAFAQLGTTKVRITGGEPALRKDLCDVIAICKQTQGIETVALTTNAFRLNKDINDYQKAGLDSLNVSADSLDPRLFAAITGKDKLKDILKGIEQALNLGLKSVKLNSVMLKQFNFKELSPFFEYLKTHKVTWRFIELMQTGQNKAFFEANHYPAEDLKKQLLNKGWERIIREKTAGPAQEFTHSDYTGNIGLIMPYSKDFCDTCNRLRVSSQAKLHLCLFAEEGISLSTYLQAGDVSAVKEAIVAHLKTKRATHFLHEGETGATKHFAMLGG